MTNKLVLIALSAALVAAPLFASADALNRQLEITMSGSDVSVLQSFLAGDATLYPQGLVTGYFGFLTKAAVSNFQVRNGIPAVGRVGPMTLPILNLQIAAGMGDKDAPIITAVTIGASRNGAIVAWNTNEVARGVVYYSTNPLVLVEHATTADVSGNTAQSDTSFRSVQNVSLSGLAANTTYYYLVYTTDQAGNVSITWPSTFQTSN